MARLSLKPETRFFIDQLSQELSTKIANSTLASKLISLCISRDPEVISGLNQPIVLFDNPEDINTLINSGDSQKKIAIIQRNQRYFGELLTSILRNFVKSAYEELKQFEPKQLNFEESKANYASQVISNEPWSSNTEKFKEAVASFALFKVFLVTKTVPTDSLEVFRMNLEFKLRTLIQNKLSELGHELKETSLTPDQLSWFKFLKDKFATELSQRRFFEQSEENFPDYVNDLLASFTARHTESLNNLVSEANPEKERDKIVGFIVEQFVSLYTNLEELLKAEPPQPFPCSTA
jgi:hypothetical protein